MQIGLHVSSFTWPGGPRRSGQSGAGRGRGRGAGICQVERDGPRVADHNVGPPEHEMLEAYTTLGSSPGAPNASSSCLGHGRRLPRPGCWPKP